MHTGGDSSPDPARICPGTGGQAKISVPMVSCCEWRGQCLPVGLICERRKEGEKRGMKGMLGSLVRQEGRRSRHFTFSRVERHSSKFDGWFANQLMKGCVSVNTLKALEEGESWKAAAVTDFTAGGLKARVRPRLTSQRLTRQIEWWRQTQDNGLTVHIHSCNFSLLIFKLETLSVNVFERLMYDVQHIKMKTQTHCFCFSNRIIMIWVAGTLLNRACDTICNFLDFHVQYPSKHLHCCTRGHYKMILILISLGRSP